MLETVRGASVILGSSAEKHGTGLMSVFRAEVDERSAQYGVTVKVGGEVEVRVRGGGVELPGEPSAQHKAINKERMAHQATSATTSLRKTCAGSSPAAAASSA